MPFRYAIHERNGLGLELNYCCSDVCPDQGHVRAHFVGSSESNCLERGGISDVDNGFGIDEGCGPPELAPR